MILFKMLLFNALSFTTELLLIHNSFILTVILMLMCESKHTHLRIQTVPVVFKSFSFSLLKVGNQTDGITIYVSEWFITMASLKLLVKFKGENVPVLSCSCSQKACKQLAGMKIESCRNSHGKNALISFDWESI